MCTTTGDSKEAQKWCPFFLNGRGRVNFRLQAQSACWTMVLSQQDIEKAHDAFEKFDVDHSGCIDAWELKEAMKSLGQDPTDEEVFGLLSMVDTDGSGNIDFQVPVAAITN